MQKHEPTRIGHLALELVDRSQSTAIALLQDARAELRAVVDGGIDLAEKTSSSMFRFARKATQRIDEGVAETLTSIERVLGSTVNAVKAVKLPRPAVAKAAA
jgi:hypothetical protein